MKTTGTQATAGTSGRRVRAMTIKDHFGNIAFDRVKLTEFQL
jgi:hypothetical protein